MERLASVSMDTVISDLLNLAVFALAMVNMKGRDERINSASS